ncbi:MAG: DUF4838 domain-containing protein [Lentisphaeria bacterium]|nr:DUF4838 domain-containing protein [Lentisphaeria bacterium]
MNNIKITLPENHGRTAEFAHEEICSFLSRSALQDDISLTMKIDPVLGQDEFLLLGQRKYILSAGSETALLYGSYEFLRQLGFRFFSPDPWDTVIPERISELPEIDYRFKPAFALRGFFAVEKRDTPEFLLWMARNYMNLWTCNVNNMELCGKLGMKLRGNPPSGMHRLFEDYLPPEKYADKHPEYYCLHKGKRHFEMKGVEAAYNICTSNLSAASELAENIAADLGPEGNLANVSVLVFASFDNGTWCECEECKKQGNYTARLLKLADKCLKIIKQRVKREIFLIIPAYHETLSPPDLPMPDGFDYEHIAVEFFPIERCYAHFFDDPECPANNFLKQHYEAWTELKKFRIFVCEYYNVSTFASAAFVFDDFISHDLKFYQTSGTGYINYMHVSTALWGELAMTNCAFASAAAGVEFDRSDFLFKRYGTAADTMNEVYEKLRRVSRISKPFFHYLGKNQYSLEVKLKNHQKSNSFFLPGHFEESFSTETIPSAAEALKLLKEALELTTTAASAQHGRVRQLLETDIMRLAATARRAEFMFDMAQLFQAESAENLSAAMQLAKKIRDTGEAMRNDTISVSHIRSAGAPNLKLYINALTATRLQNLYRSVMEQYGLEIAPFSDAENSTVRQG